MDADVRVVLAELEGLSAQALAGLTGDLTGQERGYAAGLPDRVRTRFVVRRGLLRRLLAAQLEVDPVDVELVLDDGGKPRVAGGTCFSVSSTDGAVLCALTTGLEIGVDLERLRQVPDLDRLARRLCTPAEQAQLVALPRPDRAARFLMMWTAKEAVLKATGQGLRGDPASIDETAVSRWQLMPLELGRDYVGCVAVEGHGHAWSGERLGRHLEQVTQG